MIKVLPASVVATRLRACDAQRICFHKNTPTPSSSLSTSRMGSSCTDFITSLSTLLPERLDLSLSELSSSTISAVSRKNLNAFNKLEPLSLVVLQFCFQIQKLNVQCKALWPTLYKYRYVFLIKTFATQHALFFFQVNLHRYLMISNVSIFSQIGAL